MIRSPRGRSEPRLAGDRQLRGRRPASRHLDRRDPPNPAQPRKRFDESALAALADSIRERGVLQPVIVRPVDDGYELVAGERRWRAAEIAGEATIPALVDDALDQAGSLELALIENIVREDLSPIEQARTFSVLLDDLRMTSTVLAQTDRAKPRGHREHDATARPARRGGRDDRLGRPDQGPRKGAADRARPSPPAPARARGGRNAAGRSARSRARSRGHRNRPFRGRRRTPISALWRPGSRRQSLARSGVRRPPSRTATASRSCSTTRPPIAWSAHWAPTWGLSDAALRDAHRRQFHVEQGHALTHARISHARVHDLEWSPPPPALGFPGRVRSRLPALHEVVRVVGIALLTSGSGGGGGHRRPGVGETEGEGE